MKRLDDMDKKKQADAEWNDESYTSKSAGLWVPPEHRGKIEQAETAEQKEKLEQEYGIAKHTLRWTEFKHMQAEEMLLHVQSKVFPFLKDLNGTESNFTHHMRNAVFIIPKPSLLVEAVKTIDEIYELMEQDSDNFQDIQGDVYEFLLSEIASSGKNGQFRTPRHIIKLIAELVQPKLGDKIVDPACGSSGFLLGAYQYIVTDLAKNHAKQNNLSLDLEADEDGFIRTSIAAGLTEKAQTILQQSLFGYDIDTTMVRLGLMNLMMHGIDEPNIDYQDTLSKSYQEQDEYNVIMANPPFTGSIDKGDINENLTLKTTKSELLYVENIYRLLRQGGTAGVVIPQGVLFGSAKAFVELRKILVDRCDLKAVITMPSGVFKPYAGVSTAILIFTKVWQPDEKINQPATKFTWFYEMQSDGYSLDDKRQKQAGYGDLQDIITQYHSRNPKTDCENRKITERHKCFMVPRDEIANEENNYDLSLSRYKEDVFEEIDYDEPAVILDKLIKAEVGEYKREDLDKLESGILKELIELRGMLG